METSIGPILLIVVLMLMALFAISVFVLSRRKTSMQDDDMYEQ
ncbi:hypothetical protein [Sporosarcina sp. YIM B06819]|nr:hypothetical protein [Sporosarcina sp. YIM B06819]